MKRAYYDITNPLTGTQYTVALTEEEALRCTQDLQFAMQIINTQNGQQLMSAGAEEEPLAACSESPQNLTPSLATQLQTHATSTSTVSATEDLQFAMQIIDTQNAQLSMSAGAEEELVAACSESPQDLTPMATQLQTHATSTSTVSATEDTIYRWRESNIMLLLHIYEELKEKFSDPKISLKKAWIMVAEEANKRTKDLNVTGPQCMTKMRSLKKTYKIIKDHNSKSGNDRKTWKYYEKMNEIFGTRAWATPVALVSSDQPPPETAASIDAVEEMDANESSSHSIIPTSSRRLRDNRHSSIIKLLEAKMEQRERHEAARQARHEERLASDQALIETIKDLFRNGQ